MFAVRGDCLDILLSLIFAPFFLPFSGKSQDYFKEPLNSTQPSNFASEGNARLRTRYSFRHRILGHAGSETEISHADRVFIVFFFFFFFFAPLSAV